MKQLWLIWKPLQERRCDEQICHQNISRLDCYPGNRRRGILLPFAVQSTCDELRCPAARKRCACGNWSRACGGKCPAHPAAKRTSSSCADPTHAATNAKHRRNNRNGRVQVN